VFPHVGFFRLLGENIATVGWEYDQKGKVAILGEKQCLIAQQRRRQCRNALGSLPTTAVLR
jgi:hypothetical protein